MVGPLSSIFSNRSLVILALLFLTSGCFPTKAGSHLTHFKNEAPKVGDLAPNFIAYDEEGQKISLNEIIGGKPIVLHLGSHSCPVFRYRRFSMSSLHREFKGQVDFVFVYTQEAHPVGSNSPDNDKEWVTTFNRLQRVLIPQPETIQKRIELARWSKNELGIEYQMLIHSIDNNSWRKYGRAPIPGFIIDKNRKIVLSQAWLDPDKIRGKLKLVLED